MSDPGEKSGRKNLAVGRTLPRLRIALAAALCICLICAVFYASPAGTLIIDGAYDQLLALRTSHDPPDTAPKDCPVAIIAIDDETLNYSQLAVPELFQHQYYTRIIKALSEAGAKAVVINQILPRGDSDLSNPEKVHQWFREVSSINDRMPVLSGMMWLPHRALLPNDIYLERLNPEHFGFINLERDVDAKVRRQITRWPDCQGRIGCRSLAALAALAVNPALELPEGQSFINFDPRPDAVPQYSFIDVYDMSGKKRFDYFVNNFYGKLVIIGEINSLNRGLYPTPFSEHTNQGDTSTEIMAQSVLTLLSGREVRVMGPVSRFILVFILTLISLLPTMLGRSDGRTGFGHWLPSLMMVPVLLLSVFAFIRYVHLPVTMTLTALLIAQTFCSSLRFRELRDAGRTSQTALGLYLNPEIAEAIIQRPELLARAGERKEMTVFFSDLVDFTSLAEKTSPEALVDIVNRYFEYMEPSIERFGGVLDKFGGDSIMAFWGSPLAPEPRHALAGCLSALSQKEALTRLNSHLAAEGHSPLSALMGLNSGPMVVGNIGAENRFNYTVMGDAVNLASRLVSANKVYETSIIISETTAMEASEGVELRTLDRVRVRGREESLLIFELMAKKGGLTRDQIRARDLYESALGHYFRREFQKALALFEETLSILPEDGPADLMAVRCRDYMRIPPPANWNGINYV
ncbi:hypothetical protein C4J81_18455 [Deltaproteobacteria bacterium Smac51]|nr:hypothetical protein C4J81_18455 [Deltaproteobacteria bacterium Smac51]